MGKTICDNDEKGKQESHYEVLISSGLYEKTLENRRQDIRTVCSLQLEIKKYWKNVFFML